MQGMPLAEADALDAQMQPVDPRASIAEWLALILGLWTLVHVLSHTLLNIDAASGGVRFAWFTLAKLVVWLLPTVRLLRRAGVASLHWLGLSTVRGLGLALLWSAAWLAFLALCEWQNWSMVARGPSPEGFELAAPLLVAPLFEELAFRGAMLRIIRARGYRRDIAVVVNALAFAALHVPGWFFRLGFSVMIAKSFVGVALFGLAAGYLAWATPSLWGPIVLHFANNAWSTRALDACIASLR
jgi:membrane protease YdiL (CAAX protease family)